MVRVLLIEDEPVVRKLFTIALSEDGFEVLTTDSQVEARKMVDEGGFDLIISDYKLSDGTADSLYDWIKSSHPELARRFILTTGWPGIEGFPIILEKPFHVSTLGNLIKKTLGE